MIGQQIGLGLWFGGLVLGFATTALAAWEGRWRRRPTTIRPTCRTL